jgi:sensor histidine kinase regulating citrate/malate metabolism
MKNTWTRITHHFLPLAFILVFAAALVFVTTGQNLRLSADEALVDQATSIATTLKNQSPKGAQANTQIDVEKSTQPFIIILDKDNKVLYSTAQIDGNTPAVPENSIKTAKDKSENKFTWSPKSTVRIATVIVPYTSTDENGVVVVGKSLKEVESRTDNTARTVTTASVFGLVILFVVLWVLYKEPTDKKTSSSTTTNAKVEVSKPVVKTTTPKTVTKKK